MPEELKEWAQDTLIAMLAGLVFGGGKRWVDERQAGGLRSALLLCTADWYQIILFCCTDAASTGRTDFGWAGVCRSASAWVLRFARHSLHRC